MREDAKPVRVLAAQKISRMCFVCGEQNHFSLHCRFLVLEDGRVACLFTPQDEHQGYPGRMHGGTISSVLDELVGRLIQVKEPEMFGVTVELNVKFRRPVPLGTELLAVAWETKNTTRVLEGQAELFLEDGSVAAEAAAVYVKLSADRVDPEGSMTAAEWFDDPQPLPEVVYC